MSTFRELFGELVALREAINLNTEAILATNGVAPKCTCPKSYTQSGHTRITSRACPVHGETP